MSKLVTLEFESDEEAAEFVENVSRERCVASGVKNSPAVLWTAARLVVPQTSTDNKLVQAVIDAWETDCGGVDWLASTPEEHAAKAIEVVATRGLSRLGHAVKDGDDD